PPTHEEYIGINLSTALSENDLSNFMGCAETYSATVGFSYLDADSEEVSRTDYQNVFFVIP
ncbi:MAG: hypothetical protein K5694_05640, partial [Bacilli bacterium]|nr:hypothetical protein [Bacilli bacterium]